MDLTTPSSSSSPTQYIFPILKHSEILQCLSELSIDLNKAELSEPSRHKEKVKKVFLLLVRPWVCVCVSMLLLLLLLLLLMSMYWCCRCRLSFSRTHTVCRLKFVVVSRKKIFCQSPGRFNRWNIQNFMKDLRIQDSCWLFESGWQHAA